jgi:hypothetical protein
MTDNREFVPSGHFYSAVPNYDEVRGDADRIWRQKEPAGIRLDRDKMELLVHEMSRTTLPRWETDVKAGRRYQYENNAYSYADAIFNSCMIFKYKPRRIVEIGSGWSSACMLDSVDAYSLDTKFTFIEPYPRLLNGLIFDKDNARCELIPSRLQDAYAQRRDVFDSLGNNDILFVDSTHVLKAGSDVEMILGEILPGLRNGVIVHFHDMFWPFEYPRNWVLDDHRAWNELYAVRSFLQYNSAFEILLMTHYACQDPRMRQSIEEGIPLAMKNTGGGLWIRKIGQDNI